MSSGVAWLDTSAEEQRRVQELVGLFRDTESLDELGIGQIRDVWSDTLFPGTSTLHTRARYLLLVPWCYQAAERGGQHSAAAVQRVERRLLTALQDAGHTEGLIGRRAGAAVKTLPSRIYRSALLRYGIARESRPATVVFGDEGELVERTRAPWHPTLPPRPAGFPREYGGGFELSAPEASWLRERIVDSADGSLLAHLLLHDEPLDDSRAPWADPTCAAASEQCVRMVHHAELFSNTMHGALLLYNLLVAREYEKAGHTGGSDLVTKYATRLHKWTEECAADPRIRTWNRDEFWEHVLSTNPRVTPSTRSFVDAWLGACADRPESIPTATDLHERVAHRERVRKKAQSRLTNPEMLRRWNGASGTRPLTYRWSQVQRLVGDIHRGLEHADAAA